MKKIIVATILMFSVSGCVYQEANSTDIKKAAYFCGGIENIEQLTVYFSGAEAVQCIDGQSEAIHKIPLPKQNKERQ